MSNRPGYYALLLLAVGGCKSSPPPAPPPDSGAQVSAPVAPSTTPVPTPDPNAALSINESVHAITVARGQAFTVSLPANITTPYKWIPATNLAEAGIELLKDEYQTNPSPDCANCAGVGGRRMMTFRSNLPGEHVLSLKYQSITNSTEAPAETYQATVTVRD